MRYWKMTSCEDTRTWVRNKTLCHAVIINNYWLLTCLTSLIPQDDIFYWLRNRPSLKNKQNTHHWKTWSCRFIFDRYKALKLDPHSINARNVQKVSPYWRFWKVPSCGVSAVHIPVNELITLETLKWVHEYKRVMCLRAGTTSRPVLLINLIWPIREKNSTALWCKFT